MRIATMIPPCCGQTPAAPGNTPAAASPSRRPPRDGRPPPCALPAQGTETANVKLKRQMLLEEGVEIEGDLIGRHCVVRAGELQRLVAGKK